MCLFSFLPGKVTFLYWSAIFFSLCYWFQRFTHWSVQWSLAWTSIALKDIYAWACWWQTEVSQQDEIWEEQCSPNTHAVSPERKKFFPLQYSPDSKLQHKLLNSFRSLPCFISGHPPTLWLHRWRRNNNKGIIFCFCLSEPF